LSESGAGAVAAAFRSRLAETMTDTEVRAG
jgi:hypothetical protein